MTFGKNWREDIRRWWGIETLEDPTAAPPDILWTTRCSQTKRRVSGRPEEVYVSILNRRFYRFVKDRGLRFGVLSDKYGLHMDDERLAYYDMHPSQLLPAQKVLLGGLIRQKTAAAGFDAVAFYNNSPLMSKPYFEMLAHSGLKVFYTTRLPRVEGT